MTPHHLLRRKIISLSFFFLISKLFWERNHSRNIIISVVLEELNYLIIVYDICWLSPPSLSGGKDYIYLLVLGLCLYPLSVSLIYLCYYFWTSFTITVTVNFLYEIATNCWHGNAQFSFVEWFQFCCKTTSEEVRCKYFFILPIS